MSTSDPLVPRPTKPRYVDGVAIWFVPEEVGRTVTIHEHWAVDNGVETSGYPTREECVKFARQRWGWKGV